MNVPVVLDLKEMEDHVQVIGFSGILLDMNGKEAGGLEHATFGLRIL